MCQVGDVYEPWSSCSRQGKSQCRAYRGSCERVCWADQLENFGEHERVQCVTQNNDIPQIFTLSSLAFLTIFVNALLSLYRARHQPINETPPPSQPYPIVTGASFAHHYPSYRPPPRRWSRAQPDGNVKAPTRRRKLEGGNSEKITWRSRSGSFPTCLLVAQVEVVSWFAFMYNVASCGSWQCYRCLIVPEDYRFTIHLSSGFLPRSPFGSNYRGIFITISC